jgi:FtsZ-binding cell division protein ZapB
MTDKVVDLQLQIEELKKQLLHKEDKVADLQRQIEDLKK